MLVFQIVFFSFCNITDWIYRRWVSRRRWEEAGRWEAKGKLKEAFGIKQHCCAFSLGAELVKSTGWAMTAIRSSLVPHAVLLMPSGPKNASWWFKNIGKSHLWKQTCKAIHGQVLGVFVTFTCRQKVDLIRCADKFSFFQAWSHFMMKKRLNGFNLDLMCENNVWHYLENYIFVITYV